MLQWVVRSTIKIAVLGDFNPGFHTHHATNAALRHAADQLEIQAEVDWLPTPSLLESGAEERLAGYDALWLSSGSPYRSMEGALAGVEVARRRDQPFMAT